MAGKMVHVEIPAKDSGQAKEFYGSLFGWQFQSYGDQDYHMTQFDSESGAAISGDKMPVPGMGWFVACKDNQGTEFSLWQNDESAPTPG